MHSSNCTPLFFYTNEAKSFFDQSSAKRIFGSVSVTEDEFESLARKMDLEQSNVDRCAAILDVENQTTSATLEAFHRLTREAYRAHGSPPYYRRAYSPDK